jgi:hypothetical protein
VELCSHSSTRLSAVVLDKALGKVCLPLFTGWETLIKSSSPSALCACNSRRAATVCLICALYFVTDFMLNNYSHASFNDGDTSLGNFVVLRASYSVLTQTQTI